MLPSSAVTSSYILRFSMLYFMWDRAGGQCIMNMINLQVDSIHGSDQISQAMDLRRGSLRLAAVRKPAHCRCTSSCQYSRSAFNA